MVIFRQKEFSFNTLDSVFNTAIPSICTEIMKCIEMYETKDVRHWVVDKIVNRLIKEIKVDLTPQTLLCLGFEELTNNYNLIEVIGNVNIVNKFGLLYKSPENFINKIRSNLLKSNKYKSWFTNNPVRYSDKEYIDFYKYIALCLSNQLNPDIDEFDWDIEKVLKTMEVNYKIKPMLSNVDIQKILAKSITSIVRRLNPMIVSESSGFNNLLI